MDLRAEQVYSWLAQLREDLTKAMNRDVGAILEGQAAKRMLFGRQGSAVATRQDVPSPGAASLHPLTPTDGEIG